MFDRTYDYTKTTVEYDVYITELDGSTFEFGTFGIANTDEFMPVAIYSFNYTGNLEVVNSEDYDYEKADFTWEANKWYKLKTVSNQSAIEFYIDGNLVHTMPNFSKTNIVGVNFVHDNFGGSAYIDNIKINDELLAVNDLQKTNIKLYPNPVKDILKINLSDQEKIAEISIYNAAGQQLKTVSKQSEINVENLPKGIYMIDVKTDSDQRHQSKFIKQ